jgi:ferredoxin
LTDLVAMAVDGERCIGGGQCELLADEVFVVDDDTAVASVIEPGLLERARALDIVDRCPSGAVSFTEPPADPGTVSASG